MASVTALKGFIKNTAGEIILPISRGELIFDASGNIALHSSVFKAEAAVRDSKTNTIKSGSGQYGLMTPEDLLDLHEALSRISTLEANSGSSDVDVSALKTQLENLIDKVGFQKGEKNSSGFTSQKNTGIYEYVDTQITNHLAATDALKYKGTVGSGGTVTSLPTSNISNGDVYKVIKAGTYAGTSAKVGDLFIAIYKNSSYSWELVPSGNEIETYLKVPTTSGGTTTLSGTIEIVGAEGVSVTYNTTQNKLYIAGNGSSGDSTDLTSLTKRVTTLESTTKGLTSEVSNLQDTIDNAATTYKEVIAKNSSGALTNKDELVKVSALYETAQQITSYVANSSLQAETLDLSTKLSTAQKGYVSGTITN